MAQFLRRPSVGGLEDLIESPTGFLRRGLAGGLELRADQVSSRGQIALGPLTLGERRGVESLEHLRHGFVARDGRKLDALLEEGNRFGWVCPELADRPEGDLGVR